MTIQEPNPAMTLPPDERPTPDAILMQTKWSDLEHARGCADDLPRELRRFLDNNIMARTYAVAECLEVVSHQNSIYQATTPVALYVAALLADPRTGALEIISRDGKLPLLREVLIDWLGWIAADASDEVLAISRRHGFGEYPAQTILRAARPALLRAVLAFTGDPQPIVRRAAATAALHIVDVPEGYREHHDQLRQLAIKMLEAETGSYCDDETLNSLNDWCAALDELQADEPPRSSRYHFPRRWAYEDLNDLPLWLVFRTVIAERFQTVPEAPQAKPLFADPPRVGWDDRGFLRDFYNDILHQDTCDPHTADGVPLLVAIAVDDRVPPQQRFDAVELLFDIATVSGRHEAESWPNTPPHADPRSEEKASAAVQAYLPELLARWNSECPAVQMALAALAVVSPTARTAPALTARLKRYLDQHPAGTDAGDFTRFVLDLASDDEHRIVDSVETLTDAYWRGTSREAPLRSRAFHLLEQMLTKVKRQLTAEAIARG
ncbi:hypothetical protein [Catenulispora subtropica]|uniref:HEAT repeat domain-containing protein n=1 Tax=Catenulispora subtropica TaxID=450798 RepID=A0ABN2RC94_9ACTN